MKVVHFKNCRTGRTICGRNYDMPKRDITIYLGEVTCKACLRSIKDRRWIEEMISEGKLKINRRRSEENISEILLED